MRESNCIKKETQVEPIAYENKKETYKNCAKLIEDFKRACPYENVELADWHSSRDNYYIIYCIGGSELHHITFYVEELLLKEDE